MKSFLRRELTGDELRTVTEKTLGARLLSAEPLTGGLFNTTYLVDTDCRARAVLRLGPVNRHLLLPYEHGLMEAEVEVDRICAERGIPASEVLACDLSKTIVDRDVMFVRYIPSRAYSELTLTEEERASVLADAGRAMAKFNAVTGEKFGRVADVLHGGGFDLWSEALRKELDEWASVCRPMGIFPDEEIDRFFALFERCVPYFDEVTTPRLTHNDLWTGNILVKEGEGGRHEFAAIIDGDRAMWSDIGMEMFWLGEGAEHFYEGYGAQPEQTPSERVRRTFYALLVRVWTAYIYAAEFDDRDVAAHEREGALRTERTLLEHLARHR